MIETLKKQALVCGCAAALLFIIAGIINFIVAVIAVVATLAACACIILLIEISENQK